MPGAYSTLGLFLAAGGLGVRREVRDAMGVRWSNAAVVPWLGTERL